MDGELDDDVERDRFSDAVRLLLLIAAVGEPLDDTARRHAPPGAVSVLRPEGRLQKLDFWLRNPDYLADELLNDYERDPEEITLRLAGEILDSDEPEIAAIPMLRYLFGAFEHIDRAMSVLAAPKLVLLAHRRTASGQAHVSYHLTEKGAAVAQQATDTYPELAWFTERAALLKALAESTGHFVLALRRRQYLQRDYAETVERADRARRGPRPTTPGPAPQRRRGKCRMTIAPHVQGETPHARSPSAWAGNW